MKTILKEHKNNKVKAIGFIKCKFMLSVSLKAILFCQKKKCSDTHKVSKIIIATFIPNK